MCVPPPSLHSATLCPPFCSLPCPSSRRPPPLAAPGGSYTNFQECLLPPSVPSYAVPSSSSSSSTFAALRPLLPSPGTSRTSSRVSIATWGRVFAYYTLCVTSRLVMYARVSVGLPTAPPRASKCVCVSERPCMRGRSHRKRKRERVRRWSRGGCKGIKPEV